MAENIPWELYRSFLAVLNEGSLSGAARALGIAQPTVGRHIAALEKALALPLFTRSQTGLMPTETALGLRRHAEAMESTAAALRRAAASQGEGVRGVVRVTASEVIGVEVLPPIIAGLREAHPNLKIELDITNRVQDLLGREADIAVRMIRPRQEQLIARHVGAIEVGLHAHLDYVARHGTPASVTELSRHTLIGFDKLTPFLRRAVKSLASLDRDAFSVSTDSDLAQLALIRAAAGIGACQVPIGRRSDVLVRVLPRQVSLKMDTWITMHEDLRNSHSARVTFDALAAGMEQHISANSPGTRPSGKRMPR